MSYLVLIDLIMICWWFISLLNWCFDYFDLRVTATWFACLVVVCLIISLCVSV